MQKNISKTPTQMNYHILNLIEQMVSVAPKGTDLGLCDTMSAMLSGFFIEGGGAVTPSVDAFIGRSIEDKVEHAARTRRAAKAVSHGSFNINDMIEQLHQIVEKEGKWQPKRVEGYKIESVDFTGFQRPAVKKLKSKAYVSKMNRAVPAIPIGIIANIGEVEGKRIGLPTDLVISAIDTNDFKSHMKHLYQHVQARTEEDSVVVFDAGFNLAVAVANGINQCVIRLASNCTFGKTPGVVPKRTSARGRTPTMPKAEIVRPMKRKHKDKELPATKADRVFDVENENGKTLTVHVWESVYFLERQLKDVESETLKEEMRHLPLRVVAVYDPDFETPWLLGTPMPSLEPISLHEIYLSRWPVEGIPQAGKYILSGGGGRHFVHRPLAMQRLPSLSLIFGALIKYVAATLPPIRSGFWDRGTKPTYGRLMKQLKKVGIPLSDQLSKKRSKTSHLPVGYEAIRLSTT